MSVLVIGVGTGVGASDGATVGVDTGVGIRIDVSASIRSLHAARVWLFARRTVHLFSRAM